MYSYSFSLLFLYICLYMLVFLFTFCCRFHSTNEDNLFVKSFSYGALPIHLTFRHFCRIERVYHVATVHSRAVRKWFFQYSQSIPSHMVIPTPIPEIYTL